MVVNQVLHLASTPLVLAAGIVLIALSPTATTRTGSALYVGSALLLFGTSALYHRGTWSPKVWRVLNRFDHSNIFLFIAGSYTPFGLILLDGTGGRVTIPSVKEQLVYEMYGLILALHHDARFNGALFQVASQFNLLEMTGPEVTPEQWADMGYPGPPFQVL